MNKSQDRRLQIQRSKCQKSTPTGTESTQSRGETTQIQPNPDGTCRKAGYERCWQCGGTGIDQGEDYPEDCVCVRTPGWRQIDPGMSSNDGHTVPNSALTAAQDVGLLTESGAPPQNTDEKGGEDE